MEKEKRREGLTQKEIILFHKQVNGFSQEAQELIADLSSALLEPDVHLEFKANPDAIRGISEQLRVFGLLDDDVRLVMRYFNLSFESHPTE